MIKMLLKKIKENKGFTGQDILIAIFLTITFMSIISAIMIKFIKFQQKIIRMYKSKT